MRESLAAFTFEAVALAGTRWVELSRITCQNTPRDREATIETSLKLCVILARRSTRRVAAESQRSLT